MLISYLRRHYKIILMLLLFVGVFMAVFSLYELPTEAVLYAGALCLLIGALLFVIGFARWRSRLSTLEDMKSKVTVSLEGLPRHSGALEKSYQELLRLLFDEKNRIEARTHTERRDMADYYALWAHQIKTPIAAMRLLLQTEENRQGGELSAELFKIEQYVEMALSYLRLDSESSDYVIREYELDDIVRQAVRKYARLFILKKISLEFSESGQRALTDEKWLLFVIEQILSNALKYTAKGKIRIYASGLTLIIEDTGIGIRPEDIPRVFDKGFTGYNGREDKKSTGIGLYLCRRVCDKLGHGIDIESAPGKGTRAFIRLDTVRTIME